MDPVTILVVGVIGGMAALGNLLPEDWGFSHRLARRRRAKLSKLAEGKYARVVGRATQLQYVLEAPITGRRCLYYEVRVFEKYGETLDHEIVAVQHGVPFVLDDGSEHAIVDPTDAIVGLNADGHSGPGWRANGPGELALLARHQVKVSDVQRLCFYEGIIEVGETIAVVGTAVREIDPDATPTGPYRGAQPTLLRLTATRKRSMLISDLPQATR